MSALSPATRAMVFRASNDLSTHSKAAMKFSSFTRRKKSVIAIYLSLNDVCSPSKEMLCVLLPPQSGCFHSLHMRNRCNDLSHGTLTENRILKIIEVFHSAVKESRKFLL